MAGKKNTENNNNIASEERKMTPSFQISEEAELHRNNQAKQMKPDLTINKNKDRNSQVTILCHDTFDNSPNTQLTE